MANRKKPLKLALKNNDNEILLDYQELRKAAMVLRAVNHNLRQSMVELLVQNESMTVTDIYVKLRIEQSVASQHLAILRKAHVVKTERQGKYIFYSLNDERIDQISKFVNELNRI